MRARKRIRLALRAAAEALAEGLSDREPLGEDKLDEIRARVSASSHSDARMLGGHYVADCRLLLDEVDRLRYEVEAARR